MWFHHAGELAGRRKIRTVQKAWTSERSKASSERAFESVREGSVRAGSNRQIAHSRSKAPDRLGRCPQPRFLLDRTYAVRSHQYAFQTQDFDVRVSGSTPQAVTLRPCIWPPSSASTRWCRRPTPATHWPRVRSHLLNVPGVQMRVNQKVTKRSFVSDCCCSSWAALLMPPSSYLYGSLMLLRHRSVAWDCVWICLFVK